MRTIAKKSKTKSSVVPLATPAHGGDDRGELLEALGRLRTKIRAKENKLPPGSPVKAVLSKWDDKFGSLQEEARDSMRL
jgi:hypothetical protein